MCIQKLDSAVVRYYCIIILHVALLFDRYYYMYLFSTWLHPYSQFRKNSCSRLVMLLLLLTAECIFLLCLSATAVWYCYSFFSHWILLLLPLNLVVDIHIRYIYIPNICMLVLMVSIIWYVVSKSPLHTLYLYM